MITRAQIVAAGLDPAEPNDIAGIRRDASGCNCDVDYQCFNLECRANNIRARNYYAAYAVRRKDAP